MSGGFVGESVSKAYHAARPNLPEALVKRVIEFLAAEVPTPSLAVDVGCGTGLSTAKLAEQLPRETKLIGLDISQSQLNEAKLHLPLVEFRLQDVDSKDLPFESGSVELLTAVQAAHWFDLPHFFDEAKRVLKPNGVLVLCQYGCVRPRFDEYSPQQNQRLRQLIWDLDVDLQKAGYWETNRDMLIHDFHDVVLPYEDKVEIREDGAIFGTRKLTVGQLIDFVNTWSGMRNYKRLVSDAPLYKQFLENFWHAVPKGIDNSSILTLVYPWCLLMCRKDT